MLTCSWSCSASRGKSWRGRPSPLLRWGVEPARDDEALDLAGAFIDLGDLRVAKQFLDGEIPHVAVPAEQLHRLSRHPHRRLGGEQLRHTGVLRDVLAPVLSRSEEHTSELQSRLHLVCRLLLEKKKKI